jgi:GMP synthase (glutamine-hydrolysing)
VIKSHHNVGGLPEHMKLELVEPLRELFKDEVRRSASSWACPLRWSIAIPSPGPGLGVRILGEVTEGPTPIPCAWPTIIFIEELRNADLYDESQQAFAVFLPVRSVGVVGDNRCYEHVVALRAVETVDFMTAAGRTCPTTSSSASHPHRQRGPGVSRVVYDITGKPPATIEWE